MREIEREIVREIEREIVRDREREREREREIVREIERERERTVAAVMDKFFPGNRRNLSKDICREGPFPFTRPASTFSFPRCYLTRTSIASLPLSLRNSSSSSFSCCLSLLEFD